MAATVHVLDGHAIGFATAADLMLQRRDLADRTVAAYATTFRRVGAEFGDRPLVQVDESDLAQVLEELWGDCAPATYNRHRAALSTLWAWTTDRGWTADNLAKRVERRRERRTRTQEARQRPIPAQRLEAIWSDRNHGLRERPIVPARNWPSSA